MPTEKHRIAVTVEDWMWEAIEDYRYHKKLTSKSQAVVVLLEEALASAGCKILEPDETITVRIAARTNPGHSPMPVTEREVSAKKFREAIALLPKESDRVD